MFSLTSFQVSSDFPQVCPGRHPHNRIRLHETLHHVTLSLFPVVLQCLLSLFVCFLSVSRQAVVSLRWDYLSPGDWLTAMVSWHNPLSCRTRSEECRRRAAESLSALISAPALFPRVDPHGISLCFSHRNRHSFILLQLDFQLLRFSSTSTEY